MTPRPAGSRPVLRRAVVRHLLLTSLVAAVLSGLVAAGVWLFAEDDARRDAETVACQVANAVLVPLAGRDYRGSTGFARDELLADLAPFLRSGMVQRIKVFAVDGTAARIAFSDEPRIEGHAGTLDPDLLARLDRGEAVVESVPDDDEHVYEHDLPGERFEVYFGFRDAGGNGSMLELYVPVHVGETTEHAVAVLVPLVLAGLLLLALATVPLSVSLARRLERDRTEQRAVRTYGLAAAELARRDVVQRLHDGVIPDLSGASLLLEAISRHGDPGASGDIEVPRALVDRVHAVIAGDVRLLRELLTELLPPAPVAEEIRAALDDLVAQQRRAAGPTAGEPVVSIEVAGVEGLSEPTAALVHRIAGELVRNCFRHAGAGTVRVQLVGQPAGTVLLTVADDGVGFRPGRPRRPGHIGLQLVDRVVEENGGKVDVATAPGEGTVVTVALPHRLSGWPPPLPASAPAGVT